MKPGQQLDINTFTSIDKVKAWAVHIFTSLGLLAAFMALLSIDKEEWATSFLWLFVCFVIDSVDGTLARKFRVAEVLPKIDGKSIDFIIDFSAYAIIPTYFFYKAEMVSDLFALPAVVVMLISSALYYGKKEMVIDDQYFVGFPVLWNVAVFYMFFIFQNNQILNLILVLALAVLHFAPIRFAYPSRAKKFLKSHILFSIIGLAAALVIILSYPDKQTILSVLTIVTAVYFIGFVIYDTWFAKRVVS